jgi:hypothetical protein
MFNVKSDTEAGRLEYIDAVRWQDGKIHVLGGREESHSDDGPSYRLFHIVHDAMSGKIISEDSFISRGNSPLFMCGCYLLTCEGSCPPVLDHELALKIHEDKIRADAYDKNVREFKEANLNDLKIAAKDRNA